jgi:hypothetical protein
MSPDPELIRTIFSTLLVPKITADVELESELESGSPATPPIVISPPFDSTRDQSSKVTPPLALVVRKVMSPPEVEILLRLEAFVPVEVIRPTD